MTIHQELFRINFRLWNIGDSESFQSTIQQLLSRNKGCKNINHDKIIEGRSAAEHDTALRIVFELVKQRNLRFKCQFDLIDLEFFGNVFFRKLDFP